MVNRLGLRVKLILLCAFIVMLSGVGSAQQSMGLPTIETVGVGYVTVPADRVIVAVRIEAEDTTATAAQERTREAMETIRAEVEAMGIGDVDFVTLGVYVYHNRATVTRPNVTLRTT